MDGLFSLSIFVFLQEIIYIIFIILSSILFQRCITKPLNEEK